MKVLVSTASFGSPLVSVWLDQESSKYNITFDRLDDNTDTSRPLAMHSRLRGKMPKMISWENNPGYDYYIWIDSSFSISDSTSIERMVDYCIGTDACFFKHSGRTSVNEEANFVLDLMKEGSNYILNRYGGEKIEEQLSHYNQDEDWNDNFLIECGTFIYSSNVIKDKNHNLMKEWFYHNCLWSVQDQLSLPYLLQKFETKYKFFKGNVYNNEYTKY